MPRDLPPAAVDIIDGLLSLNINQRYGCGPPGSKYDLESLKKHPFFNNINFNNL